jgi:hypothetical protein
MHFSGVQRHDLLGISLIVIGVALVCVGLVFWPRAPRNDPAAVDGPDEFRPTSMLWTRKTAAMRTGIWANHPQRNSRPLRAGGGTILLGKQRRPRLS